MFDIEKTKEIICGIKITLERNEFNFDQAINSMSHFDSFKLRKEGKRFTFDEHLDGLIYSLLSNQRPWGPIAENIDNINKLFYNFDKNKIKSTDKAVFIRGLKEIKCGNRAIARQMTSLDYNIQVLEKIEKDHGSIDNYIESDSYQNIAQELASGQKYKLKQVGIALALEYLRNVGIDTLKPDVHIRRLLSKERLGFSNGYPDEEETIDIMQYIAHTTEMGLAYLDALMWNFCSISSANICSDKPKCHLCKLNNHCQLALA